MRVLGPCLAAFVAIASAAHAECKIGKLAELPVTMVGEKASVPVKLNGHAVQLAVDSGAFYSMLPAAVAADNALSTYPAPFGMRVVGVNGDAEVSVTKVKTFTVAGIDLSNVEFLVGGSAVTGLSGLLGQNLLHVADVEYDFANGALRLLRPRGCSGTALAYWAGEKPISLLPVTPVRGPNSQVTGVVIVNGVRLKALFDTGADTSVLTLNGARRAGIDVNGPAVVKAGLSGGLGRERLQTWIAPVAKFQIGDEQIINTKLRVGALKLEEADMLLGADFFLSHRVYIANSQYKVYFTYNGGPVFDLAIRPTALTPQTSAAAAKTASAALAEGEPQDAEAFSRRAAAFAARRDYEPALADVARAVALAPQEPRYLRQRSELRVALRQPVLAMRDLDAVLKLDPADPDAHLLRALLRSGTRDRAGELSDLDAASAAFSRGAGQRLRLGQLYASAFAYEKGLGEYDLWIATHDQDQDLAVALTGRCWARAMLGRELNKAVADGDRALRLQPGSAGALNARATAWLRRADYSRAVADYSAALRSRPRYAWALYGRSLAESRSGAAEAARADLAAAIAANPRLPELARRVGLATGETSTMTDGGGPG